MQRSAAYAIGILALVGGAVVTRGEEAPMPVYHEPHHRMVFQAGPTRILDGQLPPGDASLFHTHDHPILYLTLSGSQMKTDVLGEPEGAGRGAAGRGGDGRGRGAGRPTPPSLQNAVAPNVRPASTTSYIEHPITHRIANVGDKLFHFMAIINESAGSDAEQSATGFSGDPELTNHWFRAYRITLAPGEKTPQHQHTTPAVLVQISDGQGVAVGPMKWELNEPGRWAWFERGDAHDVRNAGTARVEFIEVEIRTP